MMLGRLKESARAIGGHEGGASAVEFAIVGSILITLLLAILQFGWALQIRSEMARAADQAVRQVMLDPDMNDEEFEGEVVKALATYDKDRLVVEAGETTVGASNFRIVTVDYDLPLGVPGLPDMLTLSVSRRTPLLPPA